MHNQRLDEIFQLLQNHFGKQYWWPGDSAFEVIIGAILTQNTNWANVEKALDNLREHDLVDVQKLHQLDDHRLAELIRPAGYYKVKTKRLKNFLAFFMETYNGDIAEMDAASTHTLRQQLLEVNGIGPETADSILLYALHRPAFVVDTYTARIMARHHLIEPNADYHQLQQLFTANLDQDIQLFNEFHALIVACGKDFCKPKPKCSVCPLRSLEHTVDPY